MKVANLLELLPKQNNFEKKDFNPIDLLIDDLLEHTIIIYNGKVSKKETMIITNKKELKKILNEKEQTIRVIEIAYS